MISFKQFINRDIKITFVGDIMLHPRQFQIEHDRGYTFEGVFDELKEIIKDSDLVIGNLETTFSGYTYKVPQRTASFCAPDEYAAALKRVGFTHLITVNNHMFDFGIEGHERTKSIVSANGMVPLEKLTVIEHNGVKINMLAFSRMFDDLRDESDYIQGISKQIQRDFRNHKREKEVADYNIAFAHWGGEYYNDPDEEQLTIGKELLDLGYDIVIGNGPHMYHRVDKINNKIIAYSLGDFCSAHDKENTTNLGKVLTVNLKNMEYTEVNTETVINKNSYKVKIKE